MRIEQKHLNCKRRKKEYSFYWRNEEKRLPEGGRFSRKYLPDPRSENPNLRHPAQFAFGLSMSRRDQTRKAKPRSGRLVLACAVVFAVLLLIIADAGVCARARAAVKGRSA
jgi:hypothetical protein